MELRCRRRSLRIAGTEVSSTPLVLPSFSSKVFASEDDKDILKQTVARIGDIVVSPILVSAYDLHQKLLDDQDGNLVLAPPLTFIDSGGYEMNRIANGKVAPYGPAEHRQALAGWPSALPAVMVNYDTYSEDLAEQIDAATSLCPGQKVGRMLLLKPGSPENDLSGTIRQIGANSVSMSGVDAVGLTEKEAGICLRDRLHTIEVLRRELDGCGLGDIPIHVFGGLDPLRSPLYFLAGADIFDGLSWLRYAYDGAQAAYLDGFASFKHPDIAIKEAKWMVRRANYIETTRMQTNMLRFLATGDPALFHDKEAAMRSLLKLC